MIIKINTANSMYIKRKIEIQFNNRNILYITMYFIVHSGYLNT